MSSMLSYKLGSSASIEIVYNSWLKYFIKNENKLLEDLKNEPIYKSLWIYDILNEDRLECIKSEFKNLYSDWTYEKISDTLREKIIKDMESYIYRIKENLIKEELDLNTELMNHTILEQDLKEKNIDYLKTINFYLEKIKYLDENLFNKNKKYLDEIKNFSSQKATILINNLRISFFELNRSNIKADLQKNNILTMYNSLQNFEIEIDQNLIKRIENFLKYDYRNENIYNSLYKSMQEKYEYLERLKIEKEYINNIIISLKKLDYLVIDDELNLENKLKSNESIILDTKDENYSIILKFNNENKLLTRFARKVFSEEDIENITDFQKIIDNENLKKWCLISKELLNYEMVTELKVVEDDEADIMYYVDRNKSRKKQEIKSKRNIYG